MKKDFFKDILKKDIDIFIHEYEKYLDKDQLDKLNNIDYDNIVTTNDTKYPFGITMFDKIYLSSSNEELIDSLKLMPNYNTQKYEARCKNLSSYIKYMCDNGYDLNNLYEDIIMYFIFDLVIKNPSFLIKGFINQEIKFLSIKYDIKPSFIYEREENIATILTNILGLEETRKMIFKSEIDTYKYLIDKFGYRYANLFYNACLLTNKEYDKIKDNNYEGINGLFDYVNNYDNLSYGEVYNYLLDFEIENNIR